MNLPARASGSASSRIAVRRTRQGALAAPLVGRQRATGRTEAVARARSRSRFGLLLLLASALFFTYVLWA